MCAWGKNLYDHSISQEISLICQPAGCLYIKAKGAGSTGSVCSPSKSLEVERGTEKKNTFVFCGHFVVYLSSVEIYEGSFVVADL